MTKKVETEFKKLEKLVLASAHAVGLEWDERKVRELVQTIAEELMDELVRQKIRKQLGLDDDVEDEEVA